MQLWSYSKTAYSVLAAPINPPADKLQAYNELIHCIQQQAIASSWQHGPSTSDRCLGEVSPGWQKTASNVFVLFLCSKQDKKLACSACLISYQDTLLPAKMSWISPCVTDSIKSLTCLFLHYYSIKILYAVKYRLSFIYSEGNNSFGCERVNKEENHTQCVLKVRRIISHLKNTT